MPINRSFCDQYVNQFIKESVSKSICQSIISQSISQESINQVIRSYVVSTWQPGGLHCSVNKYHPDRSSQRSPFLQIVLRNFVLQIIENKVQTFKRLNMRHSQLYNKPSWKAFSLVPAPCFFLLVRELGDWESRPRLSRFKRLLFSFLFMHQISILKRKKERASGLRAICIFEDCGL